MTDVVNISERRWDRSDGCPGSVTVRDMLETAIARLDRGEIEATHAIVAFGIERDGQADYHYMQAGNLSPFAQIGLLSSILKLFLRD